MKNIVKFGWKLLALVLILGSCDKLKEPFIEGADDQKEILEFKVDKVQGLIDEASKTIVLDFEAGTDVSHLVPTIKVSRYAIVEPQSGVAQNFTQPIVYTVTAYNGTTAQYTVTAAVHDADNEKSILSFKIEDPACEGDINEVAKTILLTLPQHTDVGHLVPVIEVSEGAIVEPASGVEQDFTNPVEYTVTAQNGTTAVYTVTAIVESGELQGKTVLIKDFTGVRCSNCPSAATYAHTLQHQLDEDHIIILGVHAGFLAMPIGSYPEFRTDEGTIWYNNNATNPLFSVDHVALTEGNTLYVEQIDAPVVAALAEEQTFDIQVVNRYEESARSLNTLSRVTAVTGLEGDYYVTVCLVEDNIVGMQLMPDGPDPNYVFRNVFRGTLNGTEGSPFAQGVISENAETVYDYTIDLNADYNADNCYILTYVYNKADGKIMQSAIQKIK